MFTLVQLAAACLVSGVGSVGFWTFLSKLFAGRRAGEQSEIGRLRQDVAESKRGHDACEAQLAELTRRVETVEHHHASNVPRWIVSADRRVEWINDAAQLSIFSRLGLTRDQVIGRQFAELLDAQAATEIDRLQRAALAAAPIAASAPVTMAPGMPAMLVVVVACIGRASELMFEGYAIRTQHPAVLLARGEERAAESRGASAVRLGMAGDEPEREE